MSTEEEKCRLHSLSSEQYFECLRRNNIKLFSPKQELPTWAIVLISIGMVVSIIVAVYISKKADEPIRRVSPI